MVVPLHLEILTSVDDRRKYHAIWLKAINQAVLVDQTFSYVRVSEFRHDATKMRVLGNGLRGFDEL